MSTSGSTDFTITRTQLIDAALRTVGILRAGDTITNDSTLETDITLMLNMMLKYFETKGMQLWVREETTVTLTANQSSYTVYKGGQINIDTPLRIVSAYSTYDSSDIPVKIITKQEYDSINRKTSSGRPLQLYYNYGNEQGTAKIWPVPSTTGYTLSFTYHKPYDDMDSASNNFDFPPHWFEAIKYNLAMRACIEVGRAVPQEVMLLAQQTLKDALDYGYEEGSIFFGKKEENG